MNPIKQTKKEKVLTEINDTIRKMRNNLFEWQDKEGTPAHYDKLGRDIKSQADYLKDLAYDLARANEEVRL